MDYVFYGATQGWGCSFAEVQKLGMLKNMVANTTNRLKNKDFFYVLQSTLSTTI